MSTLLPRTYEDCIKHYFKDTFHKLLLSIQQDQLIKVMALQQTSQAFILQRVQQIIDIVYKTDRQSVIQTLINENNQLRSQAGNAADSDELARARRHISTLEHSNNELKRQFDQGSDELVTTRRQIAQLQQGNRELSSQKRTLQSKNKALGDEIGQLSAKLQAADFDSMARPLKVRIQEFQDSEGRLKRKLNQTEKELQDMKNRLSTVNLERQKERTCSLVLEESSKQFERSHQQLKQRVKQAQGQMRAAETRQSKLKIEIAALRSEQDRARATEDKQVRVIELVQLRDELAEKKSKIKDLKEQIKKMGGEKETMLEGMKGLQKKAREEGYEHECTIKALELENHDNLTRMRKDHKLKMEELDQFHKREHKSLSESNQEAIESLVRIHREQLERTRRQADYKEKALNECCQVLQKKCLDLETSLAQSRKKDQISRHPRFTIEEIARLQEELALKDANIFTVENDRNAAIAEIDRLLTERHNLIADMQQLKQEIERLRVDHEKSLLQMSGIDELKTGKALQQQSNMEGQIFTLVSQNQRLANDVQLFEKRYQDILSDNHSLSLRVKQLEIDQAECANHAGKLTEQNAMLRNQLHAQSVRVSDLEKQLLRMPLLTQKCDSYDALVEKLSFYERERNELLQRNQILQVDFNQITSQLRQLHNNNRQLDHQLHRVKTDFTQAKDLLQHTRDSSARSYDQLERKKHLHITHMQRTIDDLLANFKGEKEAMMASFAEHQKRLRGEAQELSNFIMAKYQYILQSKDLQQQREKEFLLSKLQSEAHAQCRQLQADYERKQQLILHELDRERHAHEMEKNELRRSLQLEMKEPWVEDNVRWGSGSWAEGMMRMKQPELSRRAPSAYY